MPSIDWLSEPRTGGSAALEYSPEKIEWIWV